MDAFGYMPHGPCGPGHYIVDLKTAGETSKAKYAETPQAKAYLALAKLQFPNLDVRGMVFDEVRKTAVPEFRTYEVRPSAEHLPAVQDLVRHGARNVAVAPGRCNTKEEQRVYGGCRCKAEVLRADGYAVAADPFAALLA